MLVEVIQASLAVLILLPCVALTLVVGQRRLAEEASHCLGLSSGGRPV